MAEKKPQLGVHLLGSGSDVTAEVDTSGFLQVKKGLVGVFDILGFRAMVDASKDLTDLAGRIAFIVDVMRSCASASTRFTNKLGIRSARPESFQISDTLIMHTSCTRNEDIVQFLWNAQAAFFQALIWGFPLRGALALGSYVVDRNRNYYVGKPFVEAHDLEKAQEWAGVAVADSLAKEVRRRKLDKRLQKLVFSHKVPTKYGPEKCLVLNWLADPLSHLDPDHLRSKFGTPSGPRELAKIRNTQHFLRCLIRVRKKRGAFLSPKNRRMVLEEREGLPGRVVRFVLEGDRPPRRVSKSAR